MTINIHTDVLNIVRSLIRYGTQREIGELMSSGSR